MRLNELLLGQKAIIDGIENCEMYRLLGTSIAFRNQEAQHIFVRCDA